MVYIVVGLVIVFFVLIIVGVVFYYKNKYSFLYIKVNEAENNLDILLQKKQEILIKIAENLEKKKIKDVPEVGKLKSKKLDHRSLYTTLESTMNTMTKLIEDFEDKIMDQALQKLLTLLNDNENDLRAALKYYNDHATDINYYAHKFPANFVKKISHYQDVELYKIEKREKYAILRSK